MKIIKSKPITNGTRHQINLTKSILSKNNRLDKINSEKFFRSYGRSKNTGRITSWHRGGGSKSLYKKINFLNKNQNFISISTQYDSFRTAFTSLNFDLKSKTFFRTLSTNNVCPGSLLTCNKTFKDLKLGDRTQVKNVPAGSLINNLSKDNESEGKFIRSAGTCGQIVQLGLFTAKVKLPSGHVLNISTNSFVTVGSLSNNQNNLKVLGKAGKNRILGRRPIVRGIAMNPVDHPHGGRTNGGIPSVTPWGLPTKCKFYLKKK
jgi:large subunit ribosomal protein L2